MTFWFTNLPSVLFYCLVLGDRHQYIGVSIVIAIFQLLYNTFMLITWSTNPGIIPKIEVDMSLASRIAQWKPVNSKYLVTYKGVITNQLYCSTCLVIRPIRCCHWYYCNNWVERFDHHWPWISWCIGKRNYMFFIIFLTTLSLYLMLMWVASLAVVIKDAKQFGEELGHPLTSLVVFIYTFGIGWFVISLTTYHYFIMIKGETTFENLKKVYKDKKNPFNNSWLKNVIQQLFPYRGKIYLNFKLN